MSLKKGAQRKNWLKREFAGNGWAFVELSKTLLKQIIAQYSEIAKRVRHKNALFFLSDFHTRSANVSLI